MTEENKEITYGYTLREKRTKLRAGQKHSFKIIQDTMGQIYFVLLTEIGLDILAKRAFKIEGMDIEISEQTDDRGEFKHAPAEYGDYELQVGDAAFIIPAIPAEDPPYPVHIPYDMLPDKRDTWDGPTDEEINEYGLEKDEDEQEKSYHG